MERNTLNYIIDIGLLISFLLVFVTGVIKFPDWTVYFGFVYLYVPAYDLNFIHDWSGIVMGILVLAHLVLHWKWLVAMTRKFLGRGSGV